MEETNTPFQPPQRRRKTKAELFKEAYLPYLILLAAVILIITFIIGAITRNAREKTEPETTSHIGICQIAQV